MQIDVLNMHITHIKLTTQRSLNHS